MNKVTGEELKKVALALSGVTRQQVYDCVRAGEGEVNKVYIIEVKGSLGVRQQKLRQVFVDARGCDYQAYIDLENAYHIIQAIDLLPYYYFDQQNASAFNRTVDRLAVLLK